MIDATSLIPNITDNDIDEVCKSLGLNSLDVPRRSFVTANNSLDVAACPGSGKTTLIVAKLAILAKKWPHRTKGICVLSHTNVAREEIQRRLGGTVIGQRLLGYPHFIDTIHGFVNRFLALPWLVSNGYRSPTIDNDVTSMYRRHTLTTSDYWKVQNFLKNKHSDFTQIRIRSRDLSFDLGGKAFPASSNTTTFAIVDKAIKASALAGYFCHDEMFVWARALLEDAPDVALWLRRRFPLVILDEMQDTSALQGQVLHAIFPRDATGSVVQRVGDPNQAIFDDADGDADRSDPFPDSNVRRCLDIPNSYRFGPRIATLASPFALRPVGATGLCGVGPSRPAGSADACEHAIFVFPDNKTDGVLDAYGKHVLAQLGDDILPTGVVTAVGAVHQDAPDISPGTAHYPKSVTHYWKDYTAEIAKKEPHPKSLIQYFRAAQATARGHTDLWPGVERIASGLVRLASHIGDAGRLKGKPRIHRAITDVLEDRAEVLSKYRGLLRTVLMESLPLEEASWNTLRVDALLIAGALCEGSTKPASATEFLAWTTIGAVTVGAKPGDNPNPNVCRVSDGSRHVDIRLGSIHSVKGQTHLATLVLSTHWHDHSSDRILPWLLGTKVNQSGAGPRDCRRLVQAYVAMTRPTRMICLALRRSALGDTSAFTHDVGTLISRGWRVAEIVSGTPEWY